MPATILIPIEDTKPTGATRQNPVNGTKQKTTRASLLEPALRIAKSA